MGLDMYLNRYPKLGMKISSIDAIEALWDYKAKIRDCSFEQWVGRDIANELPIREVVDFCDMFKHETFYAWDYEKKHPCQFMHDQVGYWRKANAIHDWIERHVVIEGELDNELENCKHYLITQEQIERLLEDCEEVIAESKLVPGKIKNGEQYKDGKWIPCYEDGLIVEDTEIADSVMPTRKGFFFGSTEYDQFYIDDLKHTVEVCRKVLKETDFSRYELYYSASW